MKKEYVTPHIKCMAMYSISFLQSSDQSEQIPCDPTDGTNDSFSKEINILDYLNDDSDASTGGND